MPSSTTAHSRLSARGPPHIAQRIFVPIIVLVIFGITLIGLIIYLTTHLKKRRSSLGGGPYEGTLVHPQHLAAQITPFGGSGPHRGRNIPRFIHTPGENMRIAFRQPDGAWHFADSLTPFTPAGVNEIDVLPPPSASASEFSSYAPPKERKFEAEDKQEYDFSVNSTTPPPPAYHSGTYNKHFDRDHFQV